MLNRNGFMIGLGIEDLEGEITDMSKGIALLDPRYGKMTAEYIQYSTPPYYGEKSTRKLDLKIGECGEITDDLDLIESRTKKAICAYFVPQ